MVKIYAKPDTLKTASKTTIQKTEKATGDLLVTKLLIQFQKYNSETIKNDKEIPKGRYISPEERQIIDDPRLI